MVSCLKNCNGCIYAYAEWWVTDGHNRWTNDGPYIYIKDLWIHEDHRGTKCLNELINEINNHPWSKPCSHVYWNQGRKKRRSRIFNKNTATRRIVKCLQPV